MPPGTVFEVVAVDDGIGCARQKVCLSLGAMPQLDFLPLLDGVFSVESA